MLGHSCQAVGECMVRGHVGGDTEPEVVSSDASAVRDVLQWRLICFQVAKDAWPSVLAEVIDLMWVCEKAGLPLQG